MVDPATLQTIVYYPAEVLRRKASSVREVDDGVRAIAGRMIELMHEARGVGLAAPQVGLPWRMFVANWTGEPGDDHVYINPTLTDFSRETAPHEEGCLSIPHVRADIVRPVGVTVTATDLAGQRFTMTGDELDARVWQHEFDHLEGVLILDRMTKMERLANRRAIKELEDKG